MNCKRIQELLMTDYSDGEISAGLRRIIERHLSICKECKQFEQAVRKTTIEPFKKAQEIKPADYVWDQIKETIIKEKSHQPEGMFVNLRGFLHRIFYIPKPAFVLATAVVVILAAIIVTRLSFDNQKMVNGYLGEQMAFFTYLDTNELDYYDDEDYVGLGTSIEEYFF